jgi:hypothetical protein
LKINSRIRSQVSATDGAAFFAVLKIALFIRRYLKRSNDIMKVRFQADADLNKAIITATRRLEPLIDFQSAVDANLAGLSDLEVLTVVAREGRILVSHDRRTMQHAFAEFIMHQDSPDSSSSRNVSPSSMLPMSWC